MKRILIVFCSVVLSLTPSVSGTACSSLSWLPTEIYLSSSGTVEYIESPNYPWNYPSWTTCYYRVIAPSGYKISYRFGTDFSMEYDIGCDSWDYIVLYDSSTFSSMIGSFCGTVEPAPSTTTGRYLFITFRSDNSNQYRGFRAAFVVGSTPPSFVASPPSTIYAGAIAGGVIGGLFLLGIIIALTVVCVCCGNKTTGTVITPAPVSNVVVANNQGTMMANPQPAAEPPPPPVYPPTYNQAYPPPELNPAYPPPSQSYEHRPPPPTSSRK